MRNKSGLKLSAHTITPENSIGEWFTVFRLHGINHLFQTTHWCYSIMVWVFCHHNYTFVPYLACCTFKITTRCKERKALFSKVGALDFILLIISIALSEIDIIQLYIYYKHHFQPLMKMCSFKTLIWLLNVQTFS